MNKSVENQGMSGSTSLYFTLCNVLMHGTVGLVLSAGVRENAHFSPLVGDGCLCTLSRKPSPLTSWQSW